MGQTTTQKTNIFKMLFRGFAFLAFAFFMVFKIFVPYATNTEIVITDTDRHIVGWSFVIVFLIEVVIKLAKNKIEKKFENSDSKNT